MSVCTSIMFFSVLAFDASYPDRRNLRWIAPVQLAWGVSVLWASWFYERGNGAARCLMLIAALGGLFLAAQLGWLTVSLVRTATWSREHPPVGIGIGIVLTLLMAILASFTGYRVISDLMHRPGRKVHQVSTSAVSKCGDNTSDALNNSNTTHQ